jgi:hypothetical protein
MLLVNWWWPSSALFLLRYSKWQNCYTISLQFSKVESLCSLFVPDLYNLESLNLDSCKIGDSGLSHLKGQLLISYSGYYITNVIFCWNKFLFNVNFMLYLVSLLLWLSTLLDCNLGYILLSCSCDSMCLLYAGLVLLQSLVLSDTEVGNQGLCHLSGLSSLLTMFVLLSF